MKLVSAPPDRSNLLFHRLVSESGRIEVCVYPVAYGHRVRVGYTNSGCCVLDWCGGGRWSDVERLYSLAVAILSRRQEEGCFDGLPTMSRVKPFYLDEEFVRVVGHEAGEFELLKLQRIPTAGMMMGWEELWEDGPDERSEVESGEAVVPEGDMASA